MDLQQHLPEDVRFLNSSPQLTERTIPRQLLNSHMMPAERLGVLIVSKGRIRLIWEDSGEIVEVLPGHPVIIEAERLHHLELCGPVAFSLKFYEFHKAPAHAGK